MDTSCKAGSARILVTSGNFQSWHTPQVYYWSNSWTNFPLLIALSWDQSTPTTLWIKLFPQSWAAAFHGGFYSGRFCVSLLHWCRGILGCDLCRQPHRSRSDDDRAWNTGLGYGDILCSAVNYRSQVVAENSERWKEMVHHWWVNIERSSSHYEIPLIAMPSFKVLWQRPYPSWFGLAGV